MGANRGQYGTLLRRVGYTGTIISFEPAQRAFEVLDVLRFLQDRGFTPSCICPVSRHALTTCLIRAATASQV